MKSSFQDWSSRFHTYHAANPRIYKLMVSLSRELKAAGHTKCGISLVISQVRWQHMVNVTTSEPFRLNQNFAAYYARLIMKNEQDLKGFFSTRKTCADGRKILKTA